MSTDDTPVNIAKLMRTFNIEIRALPDRLKCSECKSVLKDACQVRCGCRFCRSCISHVMARGGQACPGGSQQCVAAPLSTVQRDYRADRSILKLSCVCPHAGCSHEYPLADIMSHLRVCPRKSADSLLLGLDCVHEGLDADNTSDQLQQQYCGNSTILTEMVAKVNSDMEMLKQELLLKCEEDMHWDNDIKSVRDEMSSVNDENKSIKDEIISIKREKEILSEQVRQLAEKLNQEIAERCQSDERDQADISAITETIRSNRDALSTEMEPVKKDIQSVKREFDSLKGEVLLTRMALGVGELDEWLIGPEVRWSAWGSANDISTSDMFLAEGRPYRYELASGNLIGTSVSAGELRIWVRLWVYPQNALLEWPISAMVTVTVANRGTHNRCRRQMQQCLFERPTTYTFSESDCTFTFEHAALTKAGLDLKLGVRVSCQIVPAAGQ